MLTDAFAMFRSGHFKCSLAKCYLSAPPGSLFFPARSVCYAVHSAKLKEVIKRNKEKKFKNNRDSWTCIIEVSGFAFCAACVFRLSSSWRVCDLDCRQANLSRSLFHPVGCLNVSVKKGFSKVRLNVSLRVLF